MALLLRKLDQITWFEKDTKRWPWLDEDVQGDALKNMKTTENKLSVYKVQNNKSNLNLVVAALACANKDYVAVFDYALLNEDDLSAIDVRLEETPAGGHTPCAEVNHLHCEFIELTGERVLRLTALYAKAADTDRITQKNVYRNITSCLTSGDIKKKDLRGNLLKDIEKLADRYDRAE